MMRIHLWLVGTIVFATGQNAGAAITNWSVQSFSGTLTLSGVLYSDGILSGISVEPQEQTGFVTTYSGTITTQQTVVAGVPANLQFLTASVTANNSGSWDPLPDGSAGGAPANYGLKIVNLNPLAYAALRDIELTYSSDVIDLSEISAGMQVFDGFMTSTFASGDIQFRPVVLDFGEEHALIGTETYQSHGWLVYGPTVTTLTIPTELSFSVITAGADTPVTSDDTSFFFSLSGYLTAVAPTETVPEASSLLLLGVALSTVGFAGYRRARRSGTS